jgi:hypothetical protein
VVAGAIAARSLPQGHDQALACGSVAARLVLNTERLRRPVRRRAGAMKRSNLLGPFLAPSRACFNHNAAPCPSRREHQDRLLSATRKPQMPRR